MSGVNIIIDTSIFGAAVGMTKFSDSSLIYLETSDDVADSARQLPLMVNRGLDAAGRQQIKSIMVSRGPGSFTGIRVGLAYAYGLFSGLRSAHAPDQVIAGVSSVGLFAGKLARQEGDDLAVFLPATKTTGYAAVSIGGNVILRPVDSSRENLAHEGSVVWPRKWVIIGDWVSLRDAATSFGAVIHGNLDAKSASRGAIEAMADLPGMGGDHWLQEVPEAIYLRKSTVEEKAAQSV